MSNTMSGGKSAVEANCRRHVWSECPVVVVCVDGSKPDYIEPAVAAGVMPFTAEMLKKGANLRILTVVTSFTNPNNISILI